MSKANTPLETVLLNAENRTNLNALIQEYRMRKRLRAFGLTPQHRVLFYGAPGTGKTLSAAALATELKLPFYTFDIQHLAKDNTSSALNTLADAFAFIAEHPAVYLFDEFDALAASRVTPLSSPETRRIVNDLLVRLERTPPNSVITAATNFIESIDPAFRRRFDLICRFDPPNKDQRRTIILNTLKTFKLTAKDTEIDALSDASDTLSIHEIQQSVLHAIKRAILIDSAPPYVSFLSQIAAITTRRRTFTHTTRP